MADLGNFQQAIGYYQQSIELGFQEAGVYHNLGVACAMTGQPHKAIAALEDALKRDPGLLHRPAAAQRNPGQTGTRNREAKMTNPQTTLSVAINADPQRVAEFVLNGANLVKWAATFCQSAEPDGEAWRVQTPQGPVTIRLAKPNPFGILDHTVHPPEGEAVYVPMRVIPNGNGCEVLFTLFHLPSMSDERFKADLDYVRRDLARLKEMMEHMVSEDDSPR